MKLKFNYPHTHQCAAVVLTCIDFRFWRETLEFVEKKLRLESFDFPSLPGAAKAINEGQELAWDCLDVSCRLHQVEKIVIVNHSDCGAYGGKQKFGGNREKEEVFHRKELKKAEARIKKEFPEKQVILVYARLTKNEEEVEFIRVN